MGIDLRVESESGEVQDEILDDHNLTEKLLPDHDDTTSPCLRYVDRDGDTVFNQLQLPVLMQELETRLRAARKPDLQSHGTALLNLIKSAQDQDHTYVRFSGE
jgi:hypothetical protein